MEKILISKAYYGRGLNHFEDNDLIDRLNSRYTITGLMLAIFLITANIYVGEPINCWLPAQFTDMHGNYAHSFCWLKGSYYLPTDEITIPDRSKPRIYYVSYYQWTPFILLGMAILFLVPQLLWRFLTRRGGVNIRRLVHQLKSDSNQNESIASVRDTLQSYFQSRNNREDQTRDRDDVNKPLCGLSYTSIYLAIKLLCIINVIGQFIALNAFLSFQFTAHGFQALKRSFSGDDWFESPRFPRVTMCDFMIRHLGSNQHWYAVQCNLPINIYNEKIFFIFWVWLILLILLNVISIIFWITSLSLRSRSATIQRYLSLAAEDPSSRGHLTNARDTLNYLKVDGYLIFRLIAHNTDDLIAGQLLASLHRHGVRRPTFDDHFQQSNA